MSYGLIFDYDLEPGKQVELLWSHRDTELTSTFTDGGADVMDLKINYLHLGGTYGERMGSWEPFVVGGLGLTHFNPSTSGYGAKTRFSMNLGVGAKTYLTERLGLRFEARGYGTFFNGSGDVICGPQGCFAHLKSSVWTQFELNAGVIFAF